MVFVIVSSPLWLRCAWRVAIAANHTGFYLFSGDQLQQCVGRRVTCAASHGVCCCFAVMASLRMASGSCCELFRFFPSVATSCSNVLGGEWHVLRAMLFVVALLPRRNCCELCRSCVATVTTHCGNVLDGDWHVLQAMVFVICSSPLWLRCAWQVATAASYTGFYPCSGDQLQQCVGRRVACNASHGV